jgi:hypothetical protein
MSDTKQQLLVRRLEDEDYASNAQKRRMEDHVRRSGDKLFPVIVFEDDTAMSLTAFELLSNPWHYAQNCGGICKKTLVSYEDFEDIIGEEPDIPEHMATPTTIAELADEDNG